MDGSRDLIDRAASVLAEHLRLAVIALDREVLVEPLGVHADAVVELVGGIRFAVEAKQAQRALPLIDAARRAVAESGLLNAEPLVVAPYISSTVGAGIWEEGANFIDLSGNARIFVPNESRTPVAHRAAKIDRERPPRVWIDLRGHPNAYPEPGRPQTLFGAGGTRVARWLLIDPTRWWRQSELAAESHVSKGGVSKIVARLAELDQLEYGDDRTFRASRPSDLLDAWSSEYAWSRYDVIDAYLPGRGGAEATRKLATALAELGLERWAMTGASAAWLYDRYATFRTATAFTTVSYERVLEAVGAERVDRGANLQLLLPGDAGVFDGATRVGGIWCVAPVQVYLDLSQMPERADEAARELRARHLQAVDAR